MRSTHGSPRKLLLLFLGVTLGPAAGLILLGAWLLQQDRELKTRRAVEIREQVADKAIASVVRRIAESRDHLRDPRWSPGDRDALVVTAVEGVIVTTAGEPLLYRASVAPGPEAAPDVFRSGEEAEFRGERLDDAARSYRKLTRHSEESVRIGAWMRLARVERKAGRTGAALDAYAHVASDRIRFAGAPASLAARAARCALLSSRGQIGDLRQESALLASDLAQGRWHLDSAQYEAYAADVAAWCACPRPRDRESLTEAALQSLLPPPVAASGQNRRADVTVLWEKQDGTVRLLVAGRRYARSAWIAPVESAEHVTLRTDQTKGVLRPAGLTGLPWTLQIDAQNPPELADFARRRGLLLAGLSLIVVLIASGSYVVARAADRELSVARLQSDFVATVSHEFRTPLTALHQVAEILTDGRMPEGRAPAYYATIARSTRRLTVLVERLLDFGRMEAGAMPYRRERFDLNELAAALVKEVCQDVEPAGFQIQLHAPRSSSPVFADRTALTTALRNLLDNAIKYSGHSRLITVELAGDELWVILTVRDQGIGIARREQAAIFRKFVRGDSAKAAGIKGTGLGLAMVRHIVEAHGGTVSVESEPGRGSQFTLRIPCAGEEVDHHGQHPVGGGRSGHRVFAGR